MFCKTKSVNQLRDNLYKKMALGELLPQRHDMTKRDKESNNETEII